MQVALFGDSALVLQAERDLPSGITVSAKFPDVVVALGGDGTFLSAERMYPGIPKFALRDRRLCRACVDLSPKKAFQRLISGAYSTQIIHKVEGTYKNRRLVGLNEVHIHNTDPRHSIRFSVSLNKRTLTPSPFIGDGVLLATSFGSTGYFKSVTRTVFEKGWQLALNNTSHPIEPLMISDKTCVLVTLVRGPGVLIADNDPELIELAAQASVTLRVSEEAARIIQME